MHNILIQANFLNQLFNTDQTLQMNCFIFNCDVLSVINYGTLQIHFVADKK